MQYCHDRADRLTGITYPSGLELHTPRDAHGRVQQVQLQRAGFNLALVNSVDWLPFGPIKAIHFGHGETLAKDYQNHGTKITGHPQAGGGIRSSVARRAGRRMLWKFCDDARWPHQEDDAREPAGCPRQKSANGAPLSQPGAQPQVTSPGETKGLKARPIGRGNSFARGQEKAKAWVGLSALVLDCNA